MIRVPVRELARVESSLDGPHVTEKAVLNPLTEVQHDGVSSIERRGRDGYAPLVRLRDDRLQIRRRPTDRFLTDHVNAVIHRGFDDRRNPVVSVGDPDDVDVGLGDEPLGVG